MRRKRDQCFQGGALLTNRTTVKLIIGIMLKLFNVCNTLSNQLFQALDTKIVIQSLQKENFTFKCDCSSRHDYQWSIEEFSFLISYCSTPNMEFVFFEPSVVTIIRDIVVTQIREKYNGKLSRWLRNVWNESTHALKVDKFQFSSLKIILKRWHIKFTTSGCK